jgi:predicted phage replisome organizer
MSEHDSKRYFWLRLKEDFFDDDAISWLEEQANGKEYALFYLKLCLKSLKHDGFLIRTVGNVLIPYDAKKLGEITRTNEDTVMVALKLLTKIGLVEVQENGALFLTQLQSLIGSETNAAERMRKARAKAKEIGTANNVREMFAICSPEKEREKEKELEKELESGSCGCSPNSMYDNTLAEVNKTYEDYILIAPPPSDYKVLADMVDEYTAEYVIHAIKEAAFQDKRRLSYIEGILKNWKKDGKPKPWEQKKKPKGKDISNNASLWVNG